jgi:hypothetical protein
MLPILLLTKVYDKDIAAIVVLKTSLQYMIVYCDILSTQAVMTALRCRVQEYAEESAPAPTTNDYTLIHLGGPA